MIYAKLDWYSVMIYNKSIADILRKLRINVDLYDEIMSNGYERSEGFSSKFVFAAHGIALELRYDDYLSTQQEQLFEAKFSKIRLDISGSGLDYLRSVMDIDKALTDKSFWGAPEEYNITRSDFAFDFVNYKGDFVDRLLNWIKTREIQAGGSNVGRLSLGRKSGIAYSYRCGDQKTFYLGTGRSDKLVRIYDKLLQNTKNGVFIGQRPEAFKDEGEIQSWFRIEFQTRRKCADSFLFCENNDLKNVLRVIFDDYLIRDEQGKPLDMMVDLYDWESLPPIIQNQKYVRVKTVLERSTDYVRGQAFKSVFFLWLTMGAKEFVSMMNDRALEIYFGTSSSSVLGNIGLRQRLSQMLEEEKLSLDDLPGLMIDNSNYFLKLPEVTT